MSTDNVEETQSDDTIVPMFLPEKSLVRYNMKLSEDIGDSIQFQRFNTEEIKAEISAMGFMCDFHAVRDKVNVWPHDTILLVRDDEDAFGENYFWPASDSAMAKYAPQTQAEGGAEVMESEAQKLEREAQEAAEAEEERRLLTYTPPDWNARPWKSLGSEKEITDANAPSDRRPPLRLQIYRARHCFGSSYTFTDIDERQLIGCNRQIDKSYDLRRKVLDGGFQSALPRADKSVQTGQFRRVNKSCMYESVEIDEHESQALLQSSVCKEAIVNALPMMELALAQNHSINIFCDDLQQFGSDELALGRKSENVRFYNTFVDLTYSKNKRITAVDWSPLDSNTVAVSCAENRTFDERVELSSQTQSSVVMLWNFNDLVHPQLILDAPDEVFTFKFNPENDNLVIAGLANGQLVLWDIQYNPCRQSSSVKTDNEVSAELKTSESSSVHILPRYVSYIERSHAQPVQDLVWISKGKAVSKKDHLGDEDQEHSMQFISLAGESRFLIWDIRGETGVSGGGVEGENSSMRWIPLTSIDLSGFEASRMLLFDDERRSAFYSSDSGMIAAGSWLPKSGTDEETSDEPGPDETGPWSSSVMCRISAHCLACTSLNRSPHFPSLFLSVGDSTFCIWRVELKYKEPKLVFASAPANDNIRGACWSPTRAGVIVAYKQDGTLDIWDLCDQSHRPVAIDIPIAATALSAARFRKNNGNDSSPVNEQYMAIGDAGGNLHVLQLPMIFRKPIANEISKMDAFYTRESGDNTHENEQHAEDESASDTPGNTQQSKSMENTEITAEKTQTEEEREAAEIADEKRYQQMLSKFKVSLKVNIEGTKQKESQ